VFETSYLYFLGWNDDDVYATTTTKTAHGGFLLGIGFDDGMDGQY
jgi:hypothetical protein